ncbi:hypothetical protein AZE42_12527 [Rhizopogon vesiculosus]|uniref:Uncharacterized protein n=1 Tax=Rhizopogon vesiculosus TaxID=180088 RepID=A0A1J8QHQ0_9AGAM|nr:hypothetical protein AZE42_12527 [Rhizopogon vesiculosus]
MTFVLVGGSQAIHPIILNYLFNGLLGFANAIRSGAGWYTAFAK